MRIAVNLYKFIAMSAAELRLELIQSIEHMNPAQLKEFYGLLQNYINSNSDTDDWATLTPQQKQRIERSISLADEGKTIPLSSVTDRLKQKYGKNG